MTASSTNEHTAQYLPSHLALFACFRSPDICASKESVQGMREAGVGQRMSLFAQYNMNVVVHVLLNHGIIQHQ